MRTLTFFFFVVSASTLFGADWPQGAGSGGNFATSDAAPTKWSVALNQNILWKITLPETGQNTPVISKGRVYFSTLKPVEGDSTIGKDIVAWCCSVNTGEVIWKRDIEGIHNLRLSGCFSDSSSPPAVCVDDYVIFTNASGGIVCLDLEGKTVWKRDLFTVGRTLPFLADGKFIFTKQVYPPEENGNFPHKYADSPKEMWTQLHALDSKTGEDVWTSECGVNMGCTIIPQTLNDGKKVTVVGRGGGHGPPEKPDGISLVDLTDGSTLWTLPLDGFMGTMSYSIKNDEAHIFHIDEHLSINTLNGKINRRVSIAKDVSVSRMVDAKRIIQSETIDVTKKKRMITQSSNLLVGSWHYFRSYTRPYLGRVQVDSGKVEYLELPLQLSRKIGQKETLLWFSEPESKKDPNIQQQVIQKNEMKNSRGFVVFGDKRSKGSGWGHVASQTPSVAAGLLYVPVMNGTVYVIDPDVKSFDEKCIVAINDLGEAGTAWTRASISFADGKAFAHTLRELICIGSN